MNSMDVVAGVLGAIPTLIFLGVVALAVVVFLTERGK